MTLFGLSIVDVSVIVLYFAWIFWIGYRSMKRIHNQEDFFLGGRQFGRLIATFTMFGQGTSAESAVGSTTQVKQMGISGIMTSTFSNFFVLPTYFFAAQWYRRLRLLTMSSYYELRYGSKKLGVVYGISQAFFFMVVVSIGFMAMSKTIMAITPKNIEDMTASQKIEYDQSLRLEQLEKTDYSTLTEADRNELAELRLLKPQRFVSYFNKPILIIGLAIIIMIYAVGGGLEAAAKTDVLQSILTLVLTVLFIPFGVAKINSIHGSSGFVGAFETIHKVLPEMVFQLFGSPANAEMTWYLMLVFGVLTLPNVLCQANQLVISGASKDDKTARAGFVDGMLIKRFATVMWGMIGMIILALYYTDNSDPDLMWGLATRDLLGSLGIGLAGLMVACLMSALMSAADAHMITVSGLLTDGVYKVLRPGKSEKHYVLIGRICCAVYLIGGVSMAMYAKDIWSMFKYLMTLNFVFAAPFLMGILWRRANAKASWATVIVAGLVTVLLPLLAPMVGLNKHEKFLKVNYSKEFTYTYLASTFDVSERQEAIRRWQELDAKGEAVGDCPKPLVEGQKFEKVFASKERAIFWNNISATRDENGNLIKKGDGMLKADLLLLYCCGVPLEKFSFPMLETLRYVTQFVLSFAVFIIVALLTKPYDKDKLDHFYGRLRTPSYSDHKKDAQEMALTEADPLRFNDRKLFPNSSWEFNRWYKFEFYGVLKILFFVILIYISLFAVVKIGS
ncbi:MAG: sodium:solute symporter [Sedimentisphaeraceae bacterium JB056]